MRRHPLSEPEQEEDNTIVSCAISVHQFINPDGNMAYTVKCMGDVPLSTKIGLLELAKLTLVEDSL